MSATADVAHDEPELLDVEPAAVSSLGTLHIHNVADGSMRNTTSSGPRSLLVQQRKPGSHGNASNDDEDEDDDDDDETIDADGAKLAIVQPGQ